MKCPITQEGFHDPVIASDGQIYERCAITSWFEENNKSPVTREDFKHKNLCPLPKQFIENLNNGEDDIHNTEGCTYCNVSAKYRRYLNLDNIFTDGFLSLDLETQIKITDCIDLDAQTNDGWQLLNKLCRISNVDTRLIKHVVERGADINHRIHADGWRPIHQICYFGNAESIKFLIDKGTELSHLTNSSETVFELVARNSRLGSSQKTDIFQYIFEHFTDFEMEYHENPILIHCLKNHRRFMSDETISSLIDRGVRSAGLLSWAISNGKQEIVPKLISEIDNKDEVFSEIVKSGNIDTLEHTLLTMPLSEEEQLNLLREALICENDDIAFFLLNNQFPCQGLLNLAVTNNKPLEIIKYIFKRTKEQMSNLIGIAANHENHDVFNFLVDKGLPIDGFFSESIMGCVKGGDYIRVMSRCSDLERSYYAAIKCPDKAALNYLVDRSISCKSEIPVELFRRRFPNDVIIRVIDLATTLDGTLLVNAIEHSNEEVVLHLIRLLKRQDNIPIVGTQMWKNILYAIKNL